MVFWSFITQQPTQTQYGDRMICSISSIGSASGRNANPIMKLAAEMQARITKEKGKPDFGSILTVVLDDHRLHCYICRRHRVTKNCPPASN